MTTKHFVGLLGAVMAVTVTVAHTRRSGPVDPASRTFQVSGVVTAPAADGRMMVAHDEVPGYMPAMTMPFALGAGEVPRLKVGDRVRFTLRVTSSSSQADAIEVIGHDAAVAAALRSDPGRSPKRLKKGDALPAFSLTTADGRTLTARDLEGQVTAITFIFTRCPVPDFCPLMVKRFQQLQRVVAAEGSLSGVRLLSVTVDPAFDTPPVLHAYAASMKADPARWQFATGDADEIARLTSAFAVHVERNGVLIDHTLATAVIGRDGRVSEIWRGNGWSATDVVDVLRRTAAAR